MRYNHSRPMTCTQRGARRTSAARKSIVAPTHSATGTSRRSRCSCDPQLLLGRAETHDQDVGPGPVDRRHQGVVLAGIHLETGSRAGDTDHLRGGPAVSDGGHRPFRDPGRAAEEEQPQPRGGHVEERRDEIGSRDPGGQGATDASGQRDERRPVGEDEVGVLVDGPERRLLVEQHHVVHVRRHDHPASPVRPMGPAQHRGDRARHVERVDPSSTQFDALPVHTPEPPLIRAVERPPPALKLPGQSVNLLSRAVRGGLHGGIPRQ